MEKMLFRGISTLECMFLACDRRNPRLSSGHELNRDVDRNRMVGFQTQ
jgi:hypothetical protein